MASTSLLLAGCRNRGPSATSLPTASPKSVALPGSDTAADAPQAPSVAESAARSTTVGITAYTDPESGVTFRYPSAWRPWHSGSAMYPPAFTQAAGPARVTQVFDPQGTALAKTNLVGLSFSYTVKTGMDAAACAQFALRSTAGGTATPPQTINGISYTGAEGSDAGMCHQMSSIVNTARHGSRCYLFERDLETVCPEVRGPGNPIALSPAQLEALHAELATVMGSVALQ